jgi:Berberine and berberine like
MGGAVSRVDPDATAVGEREVGFDLNLAAGWPPADPDPDRHLAWVRRGWQALRPHSVGVYANFLSDEGAAGVEAAYGARLRRLTALKDRYDPGNVFRLNANIPPTHHGRQQVEGAGQATRGVALPGRHQRRRGYQPWPGSKARPGSGASSRRTVASIRP